MSLKFINLSPHEIWTYPTCVPNESKVTLEIKAKGDRFPIDVVLVIDSSDSMASEKIPKSEINRTDKCILKDPTNERLNASINFLKKLDFDKDRIGVIEFDEDANVLVDLTNNSELAINEINKIDSAGYTCVDKRLKAAACLLPY